MNLPLKKYYSNIFVTTVCVYYFNIYISIYINIKEVNKIFFIYYCKIFILSIIIYNKLYLIQIKIDLIIIKLFYYNIIKLIRISFIFIFSFYITILSFKRKYHDFHTDPCQKARNVNFSYMASCNTLGIEKSFET